MLERAADDAVATEREMAAVQSNLKVVQGGLVQLDPEREVLQSPAPSHVIGRRTTMCARVSLLVTHLTPGLTHPRQALAAQLEASNAELVAAREAMRQASVESTEWRAKAVALEQRAREAELAAEPYKARAETLAQQLQEAADQKAQVYMCMQIFYRPVE